MCKEKRKEITISELFFPTLSSPDSTSIGQSGVEAKWQKNLLMFSIKFSLLVVRVE
jgi:hypothetical protein